jgi:hypothetical protein
MLSFTQGKTKILSAIVLHIFKINKAASLIFDTKRWGKYF